MTETSTKIEPRKRSNRLSNAFFGFVYSVREARRMRDEFYRKNPTFMR
ncbi:hypothetical protein [Fulvimarina sp. MAC8]